MSQLGQQGLTSSLARHGLSWGDPAQPRSQIPVKPTTGQALGFPWVPTVTQAQPRAPQTHYYNRELRG